MHAESVVEVDSRSRGATRLNGAHLHRTETASANVTLPSRPASTASADHDLRTRRASDVLGRSISHQKI
jgi:hypothetical protein